jgi:hypothetical protein
MVSFSELPLELVEHIGSHLGQPALYAVSQLTKSLYNIIIPLLYRHVCLLIKPGDNGVPRIDRFCFNVLNDPKLGKYVKSLRVGIYPRRFLPTGPSFSIHDDDIGSYILPNNNAIQQQNICQRAEKFFKSEALDSQGEQLRVWLERREYGAYAALIFLVLPSMHRLVLADRRNETLRPLHDILREIVGEADRLEEHLPSLAARIASINDVSYNFDSDSGIRPDEEADNTEVWQVLPFPGLRKLEFPNTDRDLRYVLSTLSACVYNRLSFKPKYRLTMLCHESAYTRK